MLKVSSLLVLPRVLGTKTAPQKCHLRGAYGLVGKLGGAELAISAERFGYPGTRTGGMMPVPNQEGKKEGERAALLRLRTVNKVEYGQR